jgi:type VI secretion system protein ImpF
MARVRPEQPLVASVLDRLLDYQPHISREPPPKRHQVLSELKQAVRRDLENLLNTRVRCRPCPPGLRELEHSLANYGLPDFTGIATGADRAREEMRRRLEEIIRREEPRFKTVAVYKVDGAEPLDRTWRFRIEALLNVEPAPEPVVFDSVLKAVTGTFEVKGGEA